MWWDKFWQIFWFVLYALNIALAIYVSVALILRKQDPVKTLSWVIIVIALPYIGLILYAFFGQNYRKQKLFSRKGAGDEKVRRDFCSELLDIMANPESDLAIRLNPFKKIVIHNLQAGHSLVGENSDIEIYFSGKDALTAMYNSIATAKEHIHLQSYIIADDFIGQKFKDLLIKKVKEGIEVRVVYDGVGCWSISETYLKEMTAAGIEVLNFSPARILYLTTKINYRNHRKLLIVDGIVGFLGGVNIAQRYYDGGEFEEWRDTHVKIVGEAVYSMQASFLLDRFFILNKNLRKRKKYYPNLDMSKPSISKDEGTIFTQIISSGPDSDWSAIMQCYFLAITNAKHHINIVTPYFTPSESILNAIKITALSGVEISLMLPERSDTKLTHWGTMSYISELLDAGVKIYLFKAGFNHSKVISIDGEFCFIGSANMDNRSFEHNFEITSVIYDSGCAQKIERQFIKDTHRCYKINKNNWKKRPKINRVYESIARLGSPLL